MFQVLFAIVSSALTGSLFWEMKLAYAEVIIENRIERFVR